MVFSISAWLAMLPFVLLFVLVVWRKWTSVKTMPLVWAITALILIFVWKVDLITIAASFIKGSFVSLEIMLIIFGAVWLVQIVREKKHMQDLDYFLSSISPDARVQALIIAWLFGGLIEGVAGFGTPVMIVAPLLVSLGFPAFLSVVLGLLANSTSVSFGAAGLPITLGLGSLGFDAATLAEVGKGVASLHFVGSIVVPLSIVYFVVMNSDHVKHGGFHKAFFDIIPFAVFSWLAFMLPYLFAAWFLGPELPSILGGAIGLLVVSVSAHYGFLVPKKRMSFVDEHKKFTGKKRSIVLALIPYTLIITLLLVSRVVLSIREFLTSFSVGWSEILGTSVSYSFSPMFTPSFYFFISALVGLFIFGFTKKDLKSTLKHSWFRLRTPLVALIFALGLVQLFLVSGEGRAGLASMPLVLAQSFGAFFSKSFVVISPFVGNFGAFMAGSSTVSNLLFGAFQAETAAILGISLVLLLSLQVVGGAIGNMISIHNVLAASSTVGLYGVEGELIRKTIKVALLYTLIVGLSAAVYILFVS